MQTGGSNPQVPTDIDCTAGPCLQPTFGETLCNELKTDNDSSIYYGMKAWFPLPDAGSTPAASTKDALNSDCTLQRGLAANIEGFLTERL